MPCVATGGTRAAVLTAVWALATSGAARAEPPGAAEVRAQTGTRLGVTGAAAFGMTASYGGALWLEHALSTDSTALVRVAYTRGYAVEAEDDGFDAVTAHLGHRWYWGAFFVALELGAAAVRELRFFDTIEDDYVEGDWEAWPSGSAGIGGKLGRLEIGLTAHVPLMAIGAHLGIDVATW